MPTRPLRGHVLALVLGLPDSIKFAPIDLQPADAANCREKAG